MRPLLRIAAIDFLNPAPLMWNFERAPTAQELEQRYAIERMSPAACAQSLAQGNADIGLIPIGAFATTPGLVVVPGCAIASLGSIRSLLLVVRAAPDEAVPPPALPGDPDLLPPTPAELAGIRSVALDSSSRTSALYTQILFRRFWQHTPSFTAHPPQLEGMLATADAALLIGDTALHALRDRELRQQRTGERLRYLDLGHLWRLATGTAWVSAFWAARSQGVAGLSVAEREQVATDFLDSRNAGLAHISELVAEWAPRLGLDRLVVHHYLTRNIHYLLDDAAIVGVQRFFAEAAALALIPAVPALEWLR